MGKYETQLNPDSALERNRRIFPRRTTPLKQVRFKKILPWFAREPSLVQRERN